MTAARVIDPLDTILDNSHQIVFPPKKLNPCLPRAQMSRFFEISEPRTQDLDRLQFGRRPSTRTDARLMASKSSTALGGADLRPATEQTCPSPTVGQFRDDIDVHEALRSRIPPFRQSRRWAKAYASRDTQPASNAGGASVGKTLSLKNARGLSCDMTTSHVPYSSDITGQSDTEFEHHRGCKPTAVPGWHILKQYRPIKRHLIPARNTKVATHKSPKRTKSARSLRSGPVTSPRRALLPRSVQGKGSATNDLRDQFDCPPTRHRQCKSSEGLRPPLDPISFVSQHTHAVKPVDSPVPSLHDFEKVKRFSQDWADKITGLDFGDDWRLSVFGPTLSTPPKTPTDPGPHKGDQKLPCVSPLSNKTVATHPPLKVTGPPQPPLRTSSKRVRTFKPTDLRHSSKSAGPPILAACKDASLSLAHDADDEADDHVSLLRHTVRRECSRTSMGQSNRAVPSKDLKSVRSVDTLTKIEAQVGNARTNAGAHQSQNMLDVTKSPLSKLLTPSGEPPERPLPELPKSDELEATSTSLPIVSETADSTDRSLAGDTEAHETLFKISSVHTLIAIPSQSARTIENKTVRKEDAADFDNAGSVRRSSFAERMADLKFANDGESHSPSSEQAPDAFLKVKRMESKRSSRIQEIKRRHVAAWSKSQDGGSIRNASTDRLDSPSAGLENNICGLGLTIAPASSLRPSPTPMPPKPDAGLTRTRKPCLEETEETFTSSDLDKFPSVPVTPPDSRSSHASEVKASQDTNRKLSRANSKSQQHSAKHMLHENAAQHVMAQEKNKRHQKPEQNLCRSPIMVVVDTNPHTSSFRAGAISPKSSVIKSDSQPASPSPSSIRRALRSRPNSPNALGSARAIKVDAISDLVDVVKPSSSASTRTKSSLRSIRSNLETARSFCAGADKSAQDRVSVVRTASRPGSSKCYYHIIDSSSSDGERQPLTKQLPATLQPSQVRTLSSPGVIMQKSHRRKDTPLTVMLKEEVEKADRELENLKRYEKRIEYLQMHLEETLNIWGRMRQSNKKQYLTTAMREGNEQTDSRLGGPEASNDISSIIGNFTCSTGFNMDRSSKDGHKSLDHTLASVGRDDIEPRRISGSSALTTTGASTDTDISAGVRGGESCKRISGSSLTDPQDYDFPASPQRFSIESRSYGKQRRLRAAAPCSSPPDAPCPSIRPHSDQISSPERFRHIVQPIMSQGQFMSPRDRAIVVPWEQQNQPATSTGTDTEMSDDSDRLSVHHEISRTDQMDALLAM